MKASSLFGGSLGLTPKVLNNGFSAGGAAAQTADINGALQILSGAMSTGVYKQMLSVAGAGVLNLCSVAAQDTTSRTIGLKIVADGVTIFDASTAANTTNHSGIFGVGAKVGANVNSNDPVLNQIPFASSLVISIKYVNAGVPTETDKLQLNYILRTN